VIDLRNILVYGEYKYVKVCILLLYHLVAYFFT
jgi:hypothetical protein